MHHHQGCQIVAGGSAGGTVPGFAGVCRGLTPQPGVMQGSSTLVFGQDQPVSGSLGTLSWTHGCSQPDAETLSFNLNRSVHEHHQERPALEPTESERILHQ